MKITNLKVFQTIIEIPVVKVFTKDYREETKYYECVRKNINKMKLRSNNYDVEKHIKILKGGNN